MTFPPEALWVTVGLSVCLVALLVALAFVCWRKIKQSCEEENAGEGERVRAHTCVFACGGVSVASACGSLSGDQMNVSVQMGPHCVCDPEAECVSCM